MNRRKRPHRDRCGAIAVEMAFVIPVLMILLSGLLDSGRYLMMCHMLDSAVREGARQAVVSTNNRTTQDIENTVRNCLSSQTFPDVAIEVYRADATSGANTGAWTGAQLGEYIAVAATATYTPSTPGMGLLPNTLTMRARCIMVSEAN